METIPKVPSVPIEEDTRYVVSPFFQSVLVAITTFIVGFALLVVSSDGWILDPYASVTSITPKRLDALGGMPTIVQVGLYVRSFPKFDMIRGEFVVDVTLWFRFDPRLISVDRLNDFTFENAAILNRSKPTVRTIGKELVARYDMRIQFNMIFNYSNFPFDGHRLNLILSNNFLSPYEVIFDGQRGHFVINPDIAIPGWRQVDWRVINGYSLEKLDEYDTRQHVYHPRTVFAIDFKRIGVRHIISIIIPLLLIFFIALFTFSIDPSRYMPITLSVTSITALIAYRFVIENLSPSVGYFMLSDYIFMLFLVSCCLVFFINIFSTHITGFQKKLISLTLHGAVWTTFFMLFAS